MFRIFPFLFFAVIAYVLIIYGSKLFGTGTQPIDALLQDVLVSLTLPSSEVWNLRVGDLIVIFGLICLGVESIKSTGIGTTAMTNHILSFIIFVGALLLFLLVDGFGTTTFFLLTAMTLVDSLAGMLVGIITARRDIGIGHGVVGGHE